MNLNGKVSNPGELRVPVTLQSRSVTPDAGGFQAPTWATIAEVMAKWSGAHGAEAWTAASIGAEQPATVLIRYQADLDTTCSVLKGTDIFEIVSIDDIQERHEYMELKVKRMRAG
jgi:SPP1 family predicted phage head-tail adaptor